MRAKTSSRVLVAVDADSNKVALSVENALIFTEDPDVSALERGSGQKYFLN